MYNSENLQFQYKKDIMTNIYFVRHGKVKNPMNIFYGRLPKMKLASLGEDQIKESAQYFQNIPISRIYSSNLLRARQSADILSECINCKNRSRTKLITEIHSHMEGKPFEFGKKSRFDHYFSPQRKAENESMTDIRDRMLKFIKNSSLKHPNQNIIAIGHGDTLMILRAHLLGLPMELDSIRPGLEKYVKYGEIYKISVDKNKISFEEVFKPNF